MSELWKGSGYTIFKILKAVFLEYLSEFTLKSVILNLPALKAAMFVMFVILRKGVP
jgi:hypothetical protein